MQRHAWLILRVIALLLAASLADAQQFDPGPQAPERFNDSNALGIGAIDHATFYCVWPESHVKRPTVTAIELATGKLRWSRSGQFVLATTFRCEDGWLMFANTFRPQMNFGTAAIEAFHIINGETGAETTIPHVESRNSLVDRTRVYRGNCLTLQGQVVKCVDGAVVGDLGPGEHQTLLVDGRLYVTTLLVNDTDWRERRRLIRRFDFESMRTELEMELPSDATWIPIAARQGVVLAKSEVAERQYQLVRIDLDQKQIGWRVTFPRHVLSSQSVWEGDDKVVLARGGPSLIRPVKVDVASGAITPDTNWNDPHALLAWHGEPTRFPDLVSCGPTRTLGRWRFQQLVCVDSTTGQLKWEQSADDHLVMRMFCQPTQMGDFVVAESVDGFDIISVETGERKPVTPPDVGLQSIRSTLTENVESSASEVADYLFHSRSNDWIWDRGLLFVPMVPLVMWLLWSLIRWRNPFTEASQTVKR